MALNRIRQAPIETRAHGALVLSELGNDGLLTFLHDKEAGAHPDHKRDTGNQTDTDTCAFHIWLKATTRTSTGTTARAVFPTKKTTKLAIEITPELIKIRWLRAIARPLLATPWPPRWR